MILKWNQILWPTKKLRSNIVTHHRPNWSNQHQRDTLKRKTITQLFFQKKTKISRAGLSEAWRRMWLAVWSRWRWSFKWKEMHSKENWYYCQRSDKCSKATLMLQYQNEIPQNILFMRCIKRSTTPFLSFGCLESSYQVVLSLAS